MDLALACECGETVYVPETFSGRETLCEKCGKPVPVPETLRQAAEEPAQSELIQGADGKEFWKLTCVCGKRLLAPVESGHQFGRCSKCSRRLRLPRLPSRSRNRSDGGIPKLVEAAAPVPELIPVQRNVYDSQMATPAAKLQAVPSQKQPLRQSITNRAAIQPVEELQDVNHQAAVTAADRLRPQRLDGERAPSRHISAWPLAEKGLRALAAFIDLTCALTPVSVLAIFASRNLLPPYLLRAPVLATILFLVLLFVDGLLHVLWDGSPGKKIVNAVVRNTAGAELAVGQTFLRAMLKWLLIPGWITALFDASQRTLHDLLCGSIVMKGRAKR